VTDLVLLFDFIISLAGAIVTLFVILDPIGVLPFFQSLTRSATDEQRRKIARKAVLIAAGLLLVFAYLGNIILTLLGITVYDFEIAGGALLLVFALRDALSSEPLGVTETSQAADAANSMKALETAAIIPIATPLLAGPGSLTSVILLTKQPYGLILAGIAIVADSMLAWIALSASNKMNRFIGPSGLLIIGKVMDILMAAIAVSYLTKGIQGTGL
jgi:multiple antibiotic resistance protein